LLFEANATMVIAPPDGDERWAYRRTAISRILEAVVAMIMRKSGAPGRAQVVSPDRPGRPSARKNAG
jgi:hypothetical protein